MSGTETSSASGFIGRERELTELRAGLVDVTAGHGHLFLLGGEPGIGKTRLADEVGRLAVAQGVRVAWGRCWEGGGAPAYWPWIQVVRACLGEVNAEQRAAILGSEATPQVVQNIAQLLPELRAAYAPTPRHPGPQPADPEQARFQLFESVGTLLKNVARIEPLVIVIDDLHDADHPSLLLLKFIAGHCKDAHILLVGTYRDTEVRQSPELTRLIGDLSREGHSLPIVGMSEAEVGEFVASSSGRNADEKLVADLYQATDGNPLFVEGVVRLLVAEGKLDRAVADDAFKIPDGVQESIRRRLVKLPTKTKLLLSIASVIGNEIETQLLAQVSGSAADEIVERMEGPLRAGIAVDSGSGSSYRFSHALVREALYRDLPAKRRFQLHAEIGVAIEEVHKGNLKPHLAALAHHFRAADDARCGFDYSIAAADDAEAVFAYEDALSHLRPALAIAESHDHEGAQQAEVLFRLGRIVVFKNHEQGVAYLERALRLFEQIGDDQHAGEVHSRLGHAFRTVGPQLEPRRALIHFHRAEALLGESGKHSLGVLYKGLAWSSLDAMRIDEALSASQKAMDIYARLKEGELWAEAAGDHCWHLMVKGRLERATALVTRIGDAAAGFADPEAFKQVNLLCGWFWMLMDAPREAMRYYRLGLKRPGHDTKRQSDLLQYLTHCESKVGNLTEAERLAAENYINPAFQMRIAYYEGNWKAAAESCEKTLEVYRGVGAVWNELGSLSDLVDLRRVVGDYPGSTAALERALSLYRASDLYWEVRMRSQGVVLCFDAGQPEKAAEHLQYCHKILAGDEDWLGLAGRLWRAEAIVAALQDRFQESERHFEKSIAIFKQYSLPWHEAETLHYWGKALLQAGQLHRARQKLDAAIKIYRDHRGGQSWIDRVEADRLRAEPPSAEPQSQRGHADAQTASREAGFRNEGEFWTISYLDRGFRVRDKKGLHYIAHLLGHPNERFHVRELSASAGGNAFSPATSDPSLHADREDAPPILDSKAKADYRARLSELRADLEEAEWMNDRGRTERIRAELEFVNDELSAAMGLNGRDRKMSDPAQRIRLRICKAIRSALNGIREHDPSLAHHLATCIRTGYYCAYLPDPRQLMSWKL